MKMHQFVSFNNFSLHLEYIFRSIWALVCKFNQWFTNHPGNACNMTWCWMSSSPNIVNMLKGDLFPSRLQWTNFKNTYICTWSIIFIMLTDIHHTILYRTLTSWNLYVLHCATLNIVPIFKSIISVQEKLKTYCFTHSKCLSNFSNLGTYINTGTNHVITGK